MLASLHQFSASTKHKHIRPHISRYISCLTRNTVGSSRLDCFTLQLVIPQFQVQPVKARNVQQSHWERRGFPASTCGMPSWKQVFLIMNQPGCCFKCIYWHKWHLNQTLKLISLFLSINTAGSSSCQLSCPRSDLLHTGQVVAQHFRHYILKAICIHNKLLIENNSYWSQKVYPLMY